MLVTTRTRGHVAGHRGDQEVDCPGAAWLAFAHSCGGVDPPVGARCLVIERERVEGGFSQLEPLLAAGAFGRVIGGMRAGCQLLGSRKVRDRLRWRSISLAWQHHLASAGSHRNA